MLSHAASAGPILVSRCQQVPYPAANQAQVFSSAKEGEKKTTRPEQTYTAAAHAH